MLVYSKKPQVLRLHNLEQKQRNKFCVDFHSALTEILPSNFNKYLKSSLFLMKAISTIPDIYYTLVTLLYCKRKLGEEYTYIAMYKQKHYNQQGVLLNRKSRLLLFVLEIISRNFIIPLIFKMHNQTGSVFEKSSTSSEKKDFNQNISQKALDYIRKIKQGIGRYILNPEEIMSNMEWFILMVYMLDWNKHFTFIETLLGIRYVYTYKNDQIREVSYALQGYMLLFTFIVKALKSLYTIFKTSKKKNSSNQKVFIEIQKTNITESNKKIAKKPLCRICYDYMKERSSTRCGHIFCWSCIIQTLQLSSQCPVCRTKCYPQEVIQLRNH